MRIAFLGDIHAHPWSQFATIDPATGINSRLQLTINLLKDLAAALNQEVDLVIQLGDVFHSRQKIDATTAALTVEALKDFQVPFLCLVGNHDMWGNSARQNTLKILPANIEVIDSPRVMTISGSRIGLHPFTPNDQEFKSWAKTTGNLDLCCFHQGLKESVVGAFNVPLAAHLGIEDLPATKWAIGGHIHKPQAVTSRIHYAGSLYQTDMGERNEEKRVLILDTATEELTSVPTATPEFHLYSSLGAAKVGRHKEWDFVRIQSTPLEVRAVQDAFPNAQVEVVKELKTEKRKIDAEATQSDSGLLDAYLKDKGPTDLDVERLKSLGEGFLRASAN